jgi:arylsulfatase A-like enzyme
VVVLSDQQRPDSCGVYGQRLAVTPNLDALAGDGVVFEHAFTVQPLCGPARASLQTGSYPTRLGCWRNGLALPLGIDTLATRLGALGYRTSYVGKWHLASDRGRLPAGRVAARLGTKPVPPERRGGYVDGWVAADALERTSGPFGGHVFDAAGRRVELAGYRVDAITDLAIDELRAPDTRPRLLFVSYLEPHHQNSLGRVVGPKGWAERFRDFDPPGDLAGRAGDWRWNYAEYLAACASLDANLERLLAAVDDVLDAENTLVIYTSDHGNHFRTRNLDYKRTCHDASIRVPLVVRGPGFRGGVRAQALVTLLDLVPTLVTAAGGDAPQLDELDGRPLQHALADGAEERAHVFVQLSESQIGRAIRTRTHTYSVRAPGHDPTLGKRSARSDVYVDDKLYDNVADPFQRRNLVKDPALADLRHALAAQLLTEIERVEDHSPRIVRAGPRARRVPA